MKAGRWLENGEPIIFDGEGNILNGHNRLQAVILADVGVWFLVVRGVADPREAFRTYDDILASRKRSDRLAMEGVANGKKVQALAGLVWLAVNGRLHLAGKGDPTYRTADMFALVESDPDRFQAAVQAGETDWRRFRPMTNSHFAFCRYWLPQYGETQAADFCERLATGADLGPDDAVSLLRARLTNAAAAKTKLPAVEKLALVVKAWRYHFHGQKVRYLKWTSRGDKVEPFPDPDPRTN
jgi:hypothetical protein